MARAKKAEPAVETEAVETVECFKAFDANLACRGFAYEQGKTYEHKGPVALCSGGFHACLAPLDVLNYYPLIGSRFAKVTIAGRIDGKSGDDTKICGGSITIGAELKLPDFIKAAAGWIIRAAKGNTATGDSGHAAATGYRGHAAATGDRGHAAATGSRGHAAATGDSGHAAATGDSGHAAATGYRGHAAATGDSGHAAATGDSGHAAATGDSGHAAATGYRGHAAATGDSGHAAATGYRGHAAATGYRGHAAATGYRGHAAATGYRGHAAATGDSGIAASLGPDGVATAGATGAIMLAHWDTRSYPYKLVCVGAFMVGQDGVEAGKTYRLSGDGKPVQVSA